MYNLEFSTKAFSYLKSLKRKNEKIYRAIAFVLEDLKYDPGLGERLKRDLTGYLSYSTSGYRVVYKVYKQRKIILIAKIGPRPTVYN